MIQNQKKHKEVKFHKVNFNNPKKFIRNKTSNKMISLKTNYYEIKNKEKEKASLNSAIDNIIRKVEDKYSTFEVNNLLKAPKRNFSSKKINNNNNKNLMKEKEESKKGRNYRSSEFLKIGQNLPVYRKYNSCNKINHIIKFLNLTKI